MDYILAGVRVITDEGQERRDIVLSGGRFLLDSAACPGGGAVRLDGSGLHLFPGFTDAHVHLREPGFSYKETIKSGTLAAARGGFTTVCAMPNVNPVPDSAEALEKQLELIRRTALVRVLPYGAITEGQKGERLARLAEMADQVAGFSDDGHGVQREDMMRRAMAEARRLGRVIAAHCEDEALLGGGYIHEGDYARAHGHPGISSESEWRQVERDLRLAEESGCAYHVCHLSARESVALIRAAKARGVNVSCETAPHYLTLDDSQLQEDGRFKMNPPIRSRDDREALAEGLADGTIDMIATDHAPHSAEEKAGGLRHSLNGVVGLECAFQVIYTKLVKPGVISLQRLVSLMSSAPNKRFGIKAQGDWTLFDLSAKECVNPQCFASLGRSTPFEGMAVEGRCLLTAAGGRIVWQDEGLLRREGRA